MLVEEVEIVLEGEVGVGLSEIFEFLCERVVVVEYSFFVDADEVGVIDGDIFCVLADFLVEGHNIVDDIIIGIISQLFYFLL